MNVCDSSKSQTLVRSISSVRPATSVMRRNASSTGSWVMLILGEELEEARLLPAHAALAHHRRGHLLHGADDADRLADGVAQHPPLGVEPARGAVHVEDAELEVGLAPARRDRADRRLDAHPIGGQQAVQKRLARPVEAPARIAEQRLEVRREDEVAGREMPLPQPDAAGEQRGLHEPLGRAAENVRRKAGAGGVGHVAL